MLKPNQRWPRRTHFQDPLGFAKDLCHLSLVSFYFKRKMQYDYGVSGFVFDRFVVFEKMATSLLLRIFTVTRDCVTYVTVTSNQYLSIPKVVGNYSGIPISRTLGFPNLPISRTKPCFPWICFTQAL